MRSPRSWAQTADGDVRRARLDGALAAGELFGLTGVFADQNVNLASNALWPGWCATRSATSSTTRSWPSPSAPRPIRSARSGRASTPTTTPPSTARTSASSTCSEPPPVDDHETGVETADGSFDVDAIVYATGFDAMTGALVAVDITGRDGRTLRDHWSAGPSTYLGLMSGGLPQPVHDHRTGQPLGAGEHDRRHRAARRVRDRRPGHLRAEGLETIEPTPLAEAGWNRACRRLRRHHPAARADSWYMGANVPGKPRVFLPYVGGVDRYIDACEEVVEQDYLGFVRSGPAGIRCQDGVVRRMQYDVMLLLEVMDALGLPPLESLGATDARAFMAAAAAMNPPGPEVGGIEDGTLPGPDGPLAFRRYRPSTPGPHPILCYFHGGGWMLGDHTADDPLCRDLCVRTDSVVVSVDYRHAPEARFPAAADDAVGGPPLGGRPRRRARRDPGPV